MSKVTVQVLEINLYNGFIVRNDQVEVDLSKNIPSQCYINDEEDIQGTEDYNDWISLFESLLTGYMFKGEETLYHIILPKP